jgi:hypothetical protein
MGYTIIFITLIYYFNCKTFIKITCILNYFSISSFREMRWTWNNILNEPFQINLKQKDLWNWTISHSQLRKTFKPNFVCWNLSFWKRKAQEGIQTLNIRLGRPALYQLSYLSKELETGYKRFKLLISWSTIKCFNQLS